MKIRGNRYVQYNKHKAKMKKGIEQKMHQSCHVISRIYSQQSSEKVLREENVLSRKDMNESIEYRNMKNIMQSIIK